MLEVIYSETVDIMKVSVGVYGRFHAFNLAAELQRMGHLQCLLTSYPASHAVKYGVEAKYVSGFPQYELLKRLNVRVSSLTRRQVDLHGLIKGRFSIAIARSIPEGADIVNVWSGVAGPSIERAKSIGAISVLERGSAHPNYTAEILEEEFDLMGVAGFSSRERSNDMSEYDQADYVAVPSIFAARTFVERGYQPDKIIKVPYGVDLQEFPNLTQSETVFRVLHVGAISFQKGVHRLIKAFAELKLPNSELCLVGAVSPEMLAVLKKYEGKFKYLGVLPQSVLYKVYNQSNVFCLNSIQDGFGMVILQAMACGLPLVCSENTGGADVIDDSDCGFVVSVRDEAALKEKILQLYKDREMRQVMGENSFQKVSSRFTWEHYGEKVAKEFLEKMRRNEER